MVDEPDSKDSYLAGMTAYSSALMGRRAEAKKIAERLEMQAKQSYVSPQGYVDSCKQEGSESRFKELVRRIGLP